MKERDDVRCFLHVAIIALVTYLIAWGAGQPWRIAMSGALSAGLGTWKAFTADPNKQDTERH